MDLGAKIAEISRRQTALGKKAVTAKILLFIVLNSASCGIKKND